MVTGGRKQITLPWLGIELKSLTLRETSLIILCYSRSWCNDLLACIQHFTQTFLPTIRPAGQYPTNKVHLIQHLFTYTQFQQLSSRPVANICWPMFTLFLYLLFMIQNLLAYVRHSLLYTSHNAASSDPCSICPFIYFSDICSTCSSLEMCCYLLFMIQPLLAYVHVLLSTFHDTVSSGQCPTCSAYVRASYPLVYDKHVQLIYLPDKTSTGLFPTCLTHFLLP